MRRTASRGAAWRCARIDKDTGARYIFRGLRLYLNKPDNPEHDSRAQRRPFVVAPVALRIDRADSLKAGILGPRKWMPLP